MKAQSIESFMADWSNNETVPVHVTNNPRAKIYNDLHVELSVSARPRTIRINYIKSTKPKSDGLKQFLKYITKVAQIGGFNLSMAAQPIGGHYEDTPSKDKLKAIAESVGFMAKYEYPDELGYEMERVFVSPE